MLEGQLSCIHKNQETFLTDRKISGLSKTFFLNFHTSLGLLSLVFSWSPWLMFVLSSDLSLRHPTGSNRLGWPCLVLTVGNCSALIWVTKVCNASLQRKSLFFPHSPSLLLNPSCSLLSISTACYLVHAMNSQVSVILYFLSPLFLIFFMCFLPFLKQQVLESCFFTHVFLHPPLACILSPYILQT